MAIAPMLRSNAQTTPAVTKMKTLIRLFCCTAMTFGSTAGLKFQYGLTLAPVGFDFQRTAGSRRSDHDSFKLITKF
jgi:hypothetical protein